MPSNTMKRTHLRQPPGQRATEQPSPSPASPGRSPRREGQTCLVGGMPLCFAGTGSSTRHLHMPSSVCQFTLPSLALFGKHRVGPKAVPAPHRCLGTDAVVILFNFPFGSGPWDQIRATFNFPDRRKLSE